MPPARCEAMAFFCSLRHLHRRRRRCCRRYHASQLAEHDGHAYVDRGRTDASSVSQLAAQGTASSWTLAIARWVAPQRATRRDRMTNDASSHACSPPTYLPTYPHTQADSSIRPQLRHVTHPSLPPLEDTGTSPDKARTNIEAREPKHLEQGCSRFAEATTSTWRGGQTTCFSLRYSFSVLGPAPGPICAWEPSRLADRRGGDIGTGGHWGAVRRDSSGDEKLLDEEVNFGRKEHDHLPVWVTPMGENGLVAMRRDASEPDGKSAKMATTWLAADVPEVPWPKQDARTHAARTGPPLTKVVAAAKASQPASQPAMAAGTPPLANSGAALQKKRCGKCICRSTPVEGLLGFSCNTTTRREQPAPTHAGASEDGSIGAVSTWRRDAVPCRTSSRRTSVHRADRRIAAKRGVVGQTERTEQTEQFQSSTASQGKRERRAKTSRLIFSHLTAFTASIHPSIHPSIPFRCSRPLLLTPLLQFLRGPHGTHNFPMGNAMRCDAGAPCSFWVGRSPHPRRAPNSVSPGLSSAGRARRHGVFHVFLRPTVKDDSKSVSQPASQPLFFGRLSLARSLTLGPLPNLRRGSVAPLLQTAWHAGQPVGQGGSSPASIWRSGAAMSN
ncbi:hypothetical protein IWX48DRAFT_593704 [Phyllosticta citricarpa]